MSGRLDKFSVIRLIICAPSCYWRRIWFHFFEVITLYIFNIHLVFISLWIKKWKGYFDVFWWFSFIQRVVYFWGKPICKLIFKASYHPAKLGGHRHSGSGYLTGLVCHMILQNLVIKGSYDFMDRGPSIYVTIPPSLMATCKVVAEI